jgi:hypothetical protein
VRGLTHSLCYFHKCCGFLCSCRSSQRAPTGARVEKNCSRCAPRRKQTGEGLLTCSMWSAESCTVPLLTQHRSKALNSFYLGGISLIDVVLFPSVLCTGSATEGRRSTLLSDCICNVVIAHLSHFLTQRAVSPFRIVASTPTSAVLCGFSYLVKMIAILQTSLLLVAWAQCLSATALDDYVWRADSNYGWVDMVSFFLMVLRCQLFTQL